MGLSIRDGDRPPGRRRGAGHVPGPGQVPLRPELVRKQWGAAPGRTDERWRAAGVGMGVGACGGGDVARMSTTGAGVAIHHGHPRISDEADIHLGKRCAGT